MYFLPVSGLHLHTRWSAHCFDRGITRSGHPDVRDGEVPRFEASIDPFKLTLYAWQGRDSRLHSVLFWKSFLLNLITLSTEAYFSAIDPKHWEVLYTTLSRIRMEVTITNTGSSVLSTPLIWWRLDAISRCMEANFFSKGERKDPTIVGLSSTITNKMASYFISQLSTRAK